MIRCEVRFDVARKPGDVFAFVDEVRNVPKWLGRCIDLQQTSAPPKRVGSTLRYFYRDPGGHQGEMAGVVTEYEKDRRLTMRFTDPSMAVIVAFRFEPKESGTAVDHAVEITPKTLLTKLMSPLIRGATRRQIEQDTAKLKVLVERGA